MSGPAPNLWGLLARVPSRIPNATPHPATEGREAYEERLIANYQQAPMGSATLADHVKTFANIGLNTGYCPACDTKWVPASDPCWSCGPTSPEDEGKEPPDPDDFVHPGGWRTLNPGEC